MKREPPRHREAEKGVLGGVLVLNRVPPDVTDILKADDFWEEPDRAIFRNMVEMTDAGVAIDMLTLSARLRDDRVWRGKKTVTEYISSLIDFTPSSANLVHHARIVSDRALRRRVWQACRAAADMAAQGRGDARESALECEQLILRATQSYEVRRGDGPESIGSIISRETVELAERVESGRHITGIPTGFEDLDWMTTGLQRSDLIIVAGRTSMGKSAFAFNVITNAAKQGHKTLCLSLEMSKAQIGQRLMARESMTSLQNMRTCTLTQDDVTRIADRTHEELFDIPLWVDDEPALSSAAVRNKALVLQQQQGLDLLVVDYLQLMNGVSGKDTREREVAKMSGKLKGLAKELDIPVVALSQLNREVEGRKDKRPQISDLRESGAVEQDADMILMLYREEYYDKATPDFGIAEVIIGKQRNGPTGTVRLHFDPACQRFASLTRQGEL